ncbi:hypothetical protein ABMC89_01815 [Sulfitobacter sp. HNIBRBA3233]|uniref:hypothetical protein n=1 Tax=Sulfitobacter marinivivus TaxID=3158558 RepID=UPI0032DF93A6
MGVSVPTKVLDRIGEDKVYTQLSPYRYYDIYGDKWHIPLRNPISSGTPQCVEALRNHAIDTGRHAAQGCGQATEIIATLHTSSGEEEEWLKHLSDRLVMDLTVLRRR